MMSLGNFMFTIRESILRGTLVFYFAMGTLIIAFFAYAIRLSPEDGKTVLMLGTPILTRGFKDISPVDFLLLQLQKSSASLIMLFGVFAVAGLIPSMLEKGTVELFLSKPLSRTTLLLSRSLGATAGVALNMIYFALGIWLVFGIKIGVWHQGFLLSSLMVCVAFVFYFSIVVFTGLVSRSGGFAIMFALVFSFFSSALQAREAVLYKWWDNVIFHRALDALYYATPQLSDMLDKASYLIGKSPWEQLSPLTASAAFDIMPYVYSLLSASAIYFVSALYFSKQDF